MSDKIKVLPNVTRKKSNDNSEVLEMLDDFKEKVKRNKEITKCVVIGFGKDDTNRVISYSLSEDMPIFEVLGVLEYVKTKAIEDSQN